jgi:tRNA A37 threonylcarbamoyladenosine biosynthesis protein TsaE
MSVYGGKSEFLRSELAKTLRNELQEMVDSPSYNTHTRYSVLSPDGSHFVERHMDYMSCFLQMDHVQYVSNLKLMTRVNGGTASPDK